MTTRWLPLGTLCAVLVAVTACRDGASSPPVEVHLSVSGMHCESCVSALTQALEAVPGSRGAVVSLDRECARVVIDADRASELRPALVEAVTGLGYEAQPSEVACSAPEAPRE
jgi:copper chaperone CopZ